MNIIDITFIFLLFNHCNVEQYSVLIPLVGLLLILHLQHESSSVFEAAVIPSNVIPNLPQ